MVLPACAKVFHLSLHCVSSSSSHAELSLSSLPRVVTKQLVSHEPDDECDEVILHR